MKQVKMFAIAAIVGLVVALTYYFFEAAVRLSIDYVWDTLFQTNTYRWVVIPVCFVLTLIYFWMVHHIDPMSEHSEATSDHSALPPLTLKNFASILLIGFFSLVAGASLGPEAILVPSCMLIGAYIGMKASGGTSSVSTLMASVGLVALLTSFFNSFLIGLLTILLLVKSKKTPSISLFIGSSLIASVAALLTLELIGGHGLIELTPLTWDISLLDFVALAALFGLGVLAVVLLSTIHSVTEKYALPVIKSSWWVHGTVAAAGLIVLYLLGGPLVQFTGDQAIKPLTEQASTLGILGIAYIVAIKIIAIAWSKSIGYRGGLIFPSFFVVTGLVLIVSYISPINMVYGLIVGMVGMFVANAKYKILL